MLARFALLITRFRPVAARILRGFFLIIVIGAIVFLFELFLWPWMTTSATLKRLGLAPLSGERVTIIERRETVTVSQDENFERLVAEHGAIVVGLLAVPADGDRRAAGSPRRFSGTLLTNDGLIVTYAAVPPTATTTLLTWSEGGARHEATFVGYDALTNLAFYRAARDNTPAAAFTNVDDLRTGRRVTLFGLTEESKPTIIPTSIETHDRTFNLSPQTVASSDKWEGVFHLPVSVAPEYIGGPALLGNGEMAGIVGTRVVDGVVDTFIIPADVVRRSLERMTSGVSTRPLVGLYYVSLTPERSVALGLPRDRGALVYSPSGRTGLSVIAGSPAERSGLQYGDIIATVNGAEINLDLPLSVAFGRLNSGDMATLSVWRDGVEREVELAL